MSRPNHLEIWIEAHHEEFKRNMREAEREAVRRFRTIADAERRARQGGEEHSATVRRLGQALRSGLRPYERTALQIQRIRAMRVQDTEGIRLQEQALRQLQARMRQQMGREMANDGRSLSMLFDQLGDRMLRLPGAAGVAQDAVRGLSRSFQSGATNAEMMLGVFGGMIAIVAGVGMAAFAAASYSADFTYQLRSLQNVSGATDDELEALRDTAISLAAATAFSPKESVEGLQNLASLSFDAREQMALLAPVLDLASAGNLSVQESAMITGSTLKAYGLDVTQARGALDKLVKASSMSAVQTSDLSQAISKSAKGASVAKQDLTEMLSVMGLAKNIGLEMDVVATSVNRGLVQMATTGKKQFKDLGIEIEDGNGNFRKFGDILVDLEEKTRDMTDTQRTATLARSLGNFGMTAAIPIMDQLREGMRTSTGETLRGAEAMSYLRRQLNQSGGTLEDFRKNQLDTLKGQLTVLKGTIQTVATVFGETFEPAIKSLASSLNSVLQKLVGINNLRTYDAQKEIAKLKEEANELKSSVDFKNTQFRIMFGDSEAIKQMEAYERRLSQISGQIGVLEEELEVGAKSAKAIAVANNDTTDTVVRQTAALKDNTSELEKRNRELQKYYDEESRRLQGLLDLEERVKMEAVKAAEAKARAAERSAEALEKEAKSLETVGEGGKSGGFGMAVFNKEFFNLRANWEEYREVFLKQLPEAIELSLQMTYDLLSRNSEAQIQAYDDLKGSIADKEEELADLRRSIKEGEASEEERIRAEQLESEIAGEKAKKAAVYAEAVKAFKKQQRVDLMQITTDTALSVMKAFAQYGPPPSPMGIVASASAIIQGSIQAGIVKSRQPPQAHLGQELVGPRIGPDEQDRRLLTGEMVMNRGATRDNQALLRALNRGGQIRVANKILLRHKVVDAMYLDARRRGIGDTYDPAFGHR